MVVSIHGGTQKWMVYNGKSYWDGWFGGNPILGNLHIYIYTYICFINVMEWMEQNVMECDVMHACTFMYVYETLINFR